MILLTYVIGICSFWQLNGIFGLVVPPCLRYPKLLNVWPWNFYQISKSMRRHEFFLNSETVFLHLLCKLCPFSQNVAPKFWWMNRYRCRDFTISINPFISFRWLHIMNDWCLHSIVPLKEHERKCTVSPQIHVYLFLCVCHKKKFCYQEGVENLANNIVSNIEQESTPLPPSSYIVD